MAFIDDLISNLPEGSVWRDGKVIKPSSHLRTEDKAIKEKKTSKKLKKKSKGDEE